MSTPTNEAIARTKQEIKDLFARYGSGNYTPTPAEVAIIDRALDDLLQSAIDKAVAAESRAAQPQDALKKAVVELYEAAKWDSDLPTSKQVQLWENLRDTTGIPKGTATRLGVG